MALAVILRISHQDGGRVFLIFVADPRTGAEFSFRCRSQDRALRKKRDAAEAVNFGLLATLRLAVEAPSSDRQIVNLIRMRVRVFVRSYYRLRP